MMGGGFLISTRTTRAAALTLLVLTTSAGVLASCFSERSTETAANAEACGITLPPDAFGSTIVVIRDFAFSPTTVSIRPGTKVTWVNCEQPGSDSHTSTSDATGWSSPLLAPGDSYTREFAAAGSYPYHCAPHPSMTGTVLVE